MDNFTFRAVIFTMALSTALVSCNPDDDDNTPTYTVPDTYSFERDGQSTVYYDGQQQRLEQLELIEDYMKSANVVGSAQLDAATLHNMFSNTNAPFAGQTFTKDILSKCFAPDTAFLLGLTEQIAAVSQYTGQTASNGVPGVLVEGSPSSTAGYLVNANGLDLSEVIVKTTMGACFYYQAMEVYLSTDRMGTTGNTDMDGSNNYTPMEHYFDEAFGYLGVPYNYPLTTNGEGVHWGEYVDKRNNDPLYANIGTDLVFAFRKGRAAIVAKEYADRDQAIQTIMQKWAIVAGATAVDYLRKSLSTSGVALYKRNHQLSEAIGFMIALKYHFQGGNAKFAPAYDYTKIQEALTIMGVETNLYNLTDADINTVISKIRAAFPSGTIQ